MRRPILVKVTGAVVVVLVLAAVAGWRLLVHRDGVRFSADFASTVAL